MREQRRGSVVRPLAQDDCCDDRGGRSVDVDDRAAGEVKRAPLCEPAAAPHPVRDRRVDDQHPQRDERRIGREPHALDDRSRDQRRGDDGEGRLESHEQHVGNGALGLEADAAQQRVRQVAEHGVAAGEGERIAKQRPGERHEAERDETHHHRVERVLRSHQPAVEEGERRRHQENERGGHEHPRGIGLIHQDPPVLVIERSPLDAPAITRLRPRRREASRASVSPIC